MTDTPKAKRKNAKGAGRKVQEAITEQEKVFAESYAACGNATEAARQAGYKTANATGHQLLTRPRIQEYLAPLMVRAAEKREAERAERIATAAERQAWWTRVMMGLEGGADFKDRLKASELLGKCQGDFVERREITGKDGAPLQVDITHAPADAYLKMIGK